MPKDVASIAAETQLEILHALLRIERVLREALADDVPEVPETHTLEGEVLPGERDASQSLDTGDEG